MTKYLMVAIGGALGSVLRFWVGNYVASRLGSRFPFGTLIVNLTGSFLIGLVITAFAEKGSWNVNWRYLLPIGFIGGYTTFSAFEYETFQLFQNGQSLAAALNVTLSVVVGFAGVWAGALAGRAIPAAVPQRVPAAIVLAHGHTGYAHEQQVLAGATPEVE